jgi:sigma-B regulation protein RsbU (phosphoserine phosphatase)
VLRADSIEWLEEGGPVLGLLSIATYAYATVPLQPGDLVVVCSDGVTEARNLANEEFGRDRLVEAVKGRHGASRMSCSSICSR